MAKPTLCNCSALKTGISRILGYGVAVGNPL
jgi:hypothetical protein